MTKILIILLNTIEKHQNQCDMVFNDIMNKPNEKRRIVKLLMEKTQSSESTVYRWISGKVNPPRIKKKIIAEILNKPVEELFPDD